MKGYNNSSIPFVDLEKAGAIVFNDFDSFIDKMIFAIAKSRPHFVTAFIGTQHTMFDQTQTELLSFYKNVLQSPQHPDFKTLTQLDPYQGMEYLNLKYPCAYIGASCSIRNTSSGAYNGKERWENCVDKPVIENFPFIVDEIKSWGLFEEFGRIVLFRNEHHSFTPIHRDYHLQDEFIWISLSKNDKKFFVYDEKNNIKHYFGNARAVTFNNSDFHGSDPSNRLVISLRVDGIFTEDTRQKIKKYLENQSN
jgi:hypothetical protein